MHPPTPYSEDRPWGGFIEFTRNQPSTVKILTVKTGQALSLQTHTQRSEFWRILGGSGNITVGEEKKPAKIGDEYWIPAGTKHRLEATQTELSVLEISFGNFEEDDIVRLEDLYGRGTTEVTPR